MKLSIEKFNVTVNCALKGSIELAGNEDFRKESYQDIDGTAAFELNLEGVTGDIEPDEMKQAFDVIRESLKNDLLRDTKKMEYRELQAKIDMEERRERMRKEECSCNKE